MSKLRIYQSIFETFDDGSARITLEPMFHGDPITTSFERADVEKIIAYLKAGLHAR